MNVHIALIGGQVYPSYLGIADSYPDMLILVHSISTAEEAERISAIFPDIDTRKVVFSPVDIKDIFNQTKHLLDEVKAENNYTINITSGTKLWSVAFYECFRRLDNVRMIYIDQNDSIYDLSSLDKRKAAVDLNMDILFRLNGENVRSYIDYNKYTSEDERCLEEIRSLRRFSNQLFNEMSLFDNEQELRKDENALHFSTKRTCEEGILRWDKCSQSLTVEMTKKNRTIIKTLKSPHVFDLFFHTGWFEYEVAKMLSAWKYAKEIRMNVSFPYHHTGGMDKNEIDVIVNTGNRLLFVECKTQILNVPDIDKFQTAVKNYGGMSTKALFITEAKMKQRASEKCRNSGILPFSMNDNEPEVASRLYAMLEKELFEINKK